MKTGKRGGALFWFSALFFLLSSASVLFVPYADKQVSDFSLLYLIGGVFWGALLLAIIFICLVNRKRRKSIGKGNRLIKTRAGVFRFYSGIAAAVFDSLLIFAVLALAVLLTIQKAQSVFVLSAIAAVLFFFEMHCLLNGKNYNYLYRNNER